VLDRYRAYRKRRDIENSSLVRAARVGEPTAITRTSTLLWWFGQAATGVIVGVIALSVGGFMGYVLAAVFFVLAAWSVHMLRRLVVATRQGR
jgi:hypothetical protein